MSAALTYDDIAEWYDGWAADVPADPLFQPVEAMLPDVAGLRICDLGCGQGRVARYLVERGARVTGVEVSQRMLDVAIRREPAGGSGVAYIRDDAQTLASFRDAVFDGVVCHMAIMDIPDLDATLRSVARVLRPDGWFVFATMHPCFNAPTSTEERAHDGTRWRKVNRYWDEGFWRSDARTGPPGRVGSHHRILATYVNALVGAGLALEQAAEPVATGRFAEARPIWTEVPATLVVRCRKRIG